MQDKEIAETLRRSQAAQTLLDNEIFKTLIEDMERALLENMKMVKPDSDLFVAFGRHLHALGDLQDYIRGYIEDGLSAELYLRKRHSLD